MRLHQAGSQPQVGIQHHPILEPVLVNALISELNTGTECRLRKHANDTKLHGTVDSLKDRWPCQIREWNNHQSHEIQQQMPDCAPGIGQPRINVQSEG